MLGAERQRHVLHLLRAHGPGNVADLARQLGVSQSTVRRDLSDLSVRGLLTRVHGGASLGDNHTEGRRAARKSERSEAKRRIGEAAAQLVVDGNTLLVTGGTTTEAMIPFLTDKRRLTILTNALPVANYLVDFPDITVVVLGGLLRHEEMSLLGSLAESAMGEFHVDGAVCGAFGVDPKTGISGADFQEVGTDRRLLASGGRLVVLADASKFHQRGAVRLASVDAIDTLITDVEAPADAIESLRDRGVTVITC